MKKLRTLALSIALLAVGGLFLTNILSGGSSVINTGSGFTTYNAPAPPFES